MNALAEAVGQEGNEPGAEKSEKEKMRKKENADTSKPDILQGTLDLLILRALQSGPKHGWAISQRIQQVSEEVLSVQQGSLYPSLHRLERRGWIAAEWGASENNRRAKFYRLSDEGVAQLEIETERWQRLSAAVSQVLKHA